MADQRELNEQRAFDIADRDVRKQTLEQLTQLNSTLTALTDELRKVHAGLADVSLAIRQSALSANQQR